MFETIKKQILEIVNKPDIQLMNFNIDFIDKNVLENLVTKIKINISIDKVRDFALNENNFLSYENWKIIKSVFDGEFESYDSNENSLNDLALYIPMYKKYYIDPNYLNKQINHNSDIEVNVYNIDKYYTQKEPEWFIENTKNLDHDQIYSKKPNYSKIPSDINLNLDKDINTFKMFKNIEYKSNIKIPQLKRSINILMTNLSYKAYSKQILPMNIFNWDLDSDEYKFGNLNEKEFLELYNDIKINGIDEPILARFDRGFLSSPLIKDNIKLFIAKIMKIPFIPFIIYTSNDSNGKDLYLDELKIKNVDLIESNFLYLMNELEPYFLLNNKEEFLEPYIYSPNGKYYLGNYNLLIGNPLYKNNYDVYYLDENSKNIDPNSITKEETFAIDTDKLKEIEEMLKSF